MAELNREILNELVDLLAPHVDTEQNRRALLTEALIGESVLDQIDYSGPPRDFAVLIIKQLANYGTTESGEDALWALLQAVRNRVGAQQRERIDAMYDDLHPPQMGVLDIDQSMNWVIQAWESLTDFEYLTAGVARLEASILSCTDQTLYTFNIPLQKSRHVLHQYIVRQGEKNLVAVAHDWKQVKQEFLRIKRKLGNNTISTEEIDAVYESLTEYLDCDGTIELAEIEILIDQFKNQIIKLRDKLKVLVGEQLHAISETLETKLGSN